MEFVCAHAYIQSSTATLAARVLTGANAHAMQQHRKQVAAACMSLLALTWHRAGGTEAHMQGLFTQSQIQSESNMCLMDWQEQPHIRSIRHAHV